MIQYNTKIYATLDKKCKIKNTELKKYWFTTHAHLSKRGGVQVYKKYKFTNKYTRYRRTKKSRSNKIP